MPFEIVRNDICNMQVDAIVNAANPRPVVGYGVDSKLHQKAGKGLLSARQQIGDIAFGDAAITPAFDLDAQHVIHAVSPVWIDGEHNEAKLLEQCYAKALKLALTHQCESIAFPLLASGSNGFPKGQALQIAIHAISKFLMDNEMQIYLVVYDRKAVTLSEKLFHEVKSYIDDTYIEEPRPARRNLLRCRALEGIQFKGMCACAAPAEDECAPPMAAPRSLDDLMDELEESFSENLLRLIDQKGLKDPDVYKKANVDRKLFNKIKNNRDYKPNKSTCLAFALALELNLDETRDFIGRAGYALSHSSKFDIIIEYFIREKNYDIFELNQVLFRFGQPVLCA